MKNKNLEKKIEKCKRIINEIKKFKLKKLNKIYKFKKKIEKKFEKN